MRKHHKKWNVVQSGHCTVVLLHLAAATGRQHHGAVTVGLLILTPFNPIPGSHCTPEAFRYTCYRGLTPCNRLCWTSVRPVRSHKLTVIIKR